MAKEKTKTKKTPLILTSLILIVLFLGGCTIFCVKGSGNIETENRDIAEFTSVSLKGVGNIIITQNEKNNLKIEGDDNILQILETKVEDDVLLIQTKNGECYIPSSNLNIYVDMNKINTISISGSGKIVSTNQLNSDDLKFEITGSGNIDANVNVTKLRIISSGSGEAKLKGITDDFENQISGSGKLDAFDLKTQKSKLIISGSGNAQISVEKELDVTISGSGNVEYKGNATIVNQFISGSGKINKIK